jgi:hypothetical protein
MFWPTDLKFGDKFSHHYLIILYDFEVSFSKGNVALTTSSLSGKVLENTLIHLPKSGMEVSRDM